MKKIKLTLSLLAIIFTLIGCSSDEGNSSNSEIQNNQTELEGVWLLQNISTGARLTFENNNFKIQSGTVTINGTFELSGSLMNGQVVSRSGAYNSGLQPDNFTGNFEISNDRVTFTNFSGNWRAVFSTWYGKQ